MYCPNCGKEVSDLAVVCVGCGTSLESIKKSEGRVSAGWWWLGFLLPLAGLLVWSFCRENEPKKAKKAGIGALVGFILSIVLAVLFYVLWFVLMFFLMGNAVGTAYYL